MKKFLILIFVLIFVSSVYAACTPNPSDEGYKCGVGEENTGCGGIRIPTESMCYDCGSSDGICPEDLGATCLFCDPDDAEDGGFCGPCEEEPVDECIDIDECADYDEDNCELNPCEIDYTTAEADADVGDIVCYWYEDIEQDIAQCVDCYVCEACGEIGCTSDEEECDMINELCEENENCDDCDNLEDCYDDAFIEFCDSAKEVAGEEFVAGAAEPFPIFTWFNLIITSLILIGFYVFVHKKR